MRKRKFLTTIAAALIAASTLPAAADVAKTPNLGDGVTVDMAEICSEGCVIRIDLDRAGPGLLRKYAANAYENPMQMMVGFDRAEHGMMMFKLVSEPGSPVVFSLEAVVEYMRAQLKTDPIGGCELGGCSAG